MFNFVALVNVVFEYLWYMYTRFNILFVLISQYDFPPPESFIII